MKRFLFLICLSSAVTLVSCFFRDEKPVVAPPSGVLLKPAESKSIQAKIEKKDVKGSGDSNKDKTLNVIARYFEKADAIHREAWWVLAAERRPVGKSPFGKVQRALLSSQNMKLSNKSIFRCDRYLVKRDVMSLHGYPQRAEIFEKCSEKIEAKKIAQFDASRANEIQVVFFPENLEEILGLGATVINKSIQCTLRGNDREQLVSLKCQDWAQERSKEHMIRLDVYDYEMEGRNLIKLRGKVYENLSESRKIEADVPVEGKIFVTETELYPPEPSPEPLAPVKAVKPVPLPKAGSPADPSVVPLAPAVDMNPATITPLPAPMSEGVAIPLPRGQAVDPDVMMQQQMSQPQPEMQEQQQSLPQPQQLLPQQGQSQDQGQPQVPLQQWNPNADVPQQDSSSPQEVPQQPESNPIPAGGVYGR